MKRVITIIVVAISLMVCVCCTKPEIINPLDKDRIEILRILNPLITYHPDEQFDDGYPLPLEAIIKTTANAYVLAEIIKPLPDRVYFLYSSSGEDGLADILSKQGKSNMEIECIEYQIRILVILYQGDTPAGLLKLNEELKINIGQNINISLLKRMEANCPDMKSGLRIFIPLMIAPEKGNCYNYAFSPRGLYYVVDEKYILSAVSWPGEPSDFDGITVESFKDKIRTIRNSPSRYDYKVKN